MATATATGGLGLLGSGLRLFLGLRALAGSGGEPLLCGSGSCWVARYASISQRDAALQRLGEVPDWRCWAIG